MFAIILHLLATFIAGLFKPHRRLEVENLFLRHQRNVALRRAPNASGTGHSCPASDECAIHYNTRISTQYPAQVRLPEYDHVVETFPADRADQPLDVRILPRRSWSDRLVPNAHGAQTLPEDRAIRRVPVPNKITRCTIPGERLGDLARNPLRGRICRHPERYPQSTPVTQNHKAIEQPERNRRQHEEIDCRDTIDMVRKVRQPCDGGQPRYIYRAPVDCAIVKPSLSSSP